MATKVFNHQKRVINLTPGIPKATLPGMICRFNYKSDSIKVSDRRPMVLVLHNELLGQSLTRSPNPLIHGINLNYMSETQIKRLFVKMVDGASVYSEDKNVIITEDQDFGDFDDETPSRNLITEPYTRIKLPTFKEQREGNPISKAEAKKQMLMLYRKQLRRFVNMWDIYRSYSVENIKALRVVQYDIASLNLRFKK